MIKVLIFYNENMMKPIGGPSGYLYNLKDGLKKIKNTELEISFLKEKVVPKNKLKQKIKKWMPNFVLNLKKNRDNLKEIKGIIHDNGCSTFDFSEYDYVHFHSTEDFYHYRNTLKKYNCKVILTSHSPQPLHQEIVEKLTNVSDRKRKKLCSKIEFMDEYAFLNADYIFFPVKEALECYEKTWDKFAKIYNIIKDRIQYIPTGIIPATSKNSINIRDIFNIPSSGLIVTYVGRHNKIKGYDKLKKIGEYVLEKNRNIYFVIAGNESPIKRLKHKNWIEVGWTDQPYEYISCSDAFILPNRETYFDIALLEVLSLGKMVCLTNTGGNKYFKKFKSNGLIFYNYDDVSFVGDAILKLYKNKKECVEGGKNNKKIFDENFTSKKFAQNYCDLIVKINHEEKI